MDERERALAAMGVDALNASLAGLGYPLIVSSSDVRMAEPVVGDIPNAVVERPGVAPLRIVFGRDLNIWVGPYSEVVTVPVSEETRGLMEEVITKVLMSEIVCSYRRRSVELVLRLPDHEPWMRLRVRGSDLQRLLEPRYQPYARV